MESKEEKRKYRKLDFVKDAFKQDIQKTDIKKSKIENSKVDLSSECKPPEFVIKMKIDNKWYNIGSLGGISCWTGLAKARKGYAKMFFESAAIKNGLINDTFFVKLPDNKKKVISIDTEQDENTVKYLSKRIIAMSNVIDYSHYSAYWLREYNYMERCEIIEDIIIQNPGVGILFIDGVADLASCNNDEAEGNRVAQLLMTWTSKYNIHINTVIHQPRTHGGATGHLGSSIEKKSQSIIGIKKDGNYSIIESKMLRHSPDFTPFPFMINDKNIPELIDDKIETNEDLKQDNYYEIDNEIPF